MDDIIDCVKKTALLLKDAMYLETHYQRVLAHLLQKKDHVISTEVHVAYKLPDGLIFGSGRIDLLFETTQAIYILELKVHAKIQSVVGQLKRYMVHYPNPSQKTIRGCVVSFNHCNQSTTKFLTLKVTNIQLDQ